MKIGFDISQTGNFKAGTGYLAHSLSRALAKIDKVNEYILYPTFGDFYLDPEWQQSIEAISQSNFKLGLGHHNLDEAKRFWANPSSDYESNLGDPDIIHSNNFYCPIKLKKARLVYTLHDLGFIANPDWTTEANRTGCFEGVFHASLFADHIVAVSQYSRNYFLKIFPHFSPEKISTIPEASRFSNQNSKKIKRPANIPAIQSNQFWLNVGTLEPRKNQGRLLKAYALLKAEVGKTYPLVFAGGKGWLLEHFENTIVELDLQDDIFLLGYVSDDQLAWLYQNCFAFIYPSLFEGFGLPALEAMSMGAAVISSNTTSLPEVVGDAGLLVDPYLETEIMKAMKLLQTNEAQQEQYKNMAYKRSKTFSWENTAKTVVNLYQKIYAGG